MSRYPDTIEATGDDALYVTITFESGASGQWTDDHAGHGLRKHERLVYGSAGSLQTFGNRNGRPCALHLDDGSVIDDARILDYAPSYRLNPLMAARLADDPTSVDFCKLSGSANTWRLRVGRLRVLLEADNRAGFMRVGRILDRRDAYRG